MKFDFIGDLQSTSIHDCDLDMFFLQVEINQIAQGQNRSCLVADFKVTNQFLDLKLKKKKKSQAIWLLKADMSKGHWIGR